MKRGVSCFLLCCAGVSASAGVGSPAVEEKNYSSIGAAVGDSISDDELVISMIRLARDGAEAGDAEAMFYYALSFYYELGNNQGYGKAVNWLKKSADNEYIDAKFQLGICYKNGYGVKRDYSRAAKLR